MDPNLQPPERSHHDQDGTLDVVDVWKTIQGEGPFAGRPAIFVRLAGCNIQCPLCDTNYTTGRRMIVPGVLANKVRLEVAGIYKPLVVITGGEPLRQNLAPLIEVLLRRDIARDIQIETNGILCPDLQYDEITVVCSPKMPNINRRLQPHIKALKYILQAGQVSIEDGLPKATLGSDWNVGRPDREICNAEIYVQPLDEQDEVKNKANLDATLASVSLFGHRLCLQVHKIIGLP